MNNKKRTTKRSTYHFPVEATAALQNLADLARIQDNVTLIRTAIARYGEVLMAELQGYEFYVIDSEGESHRFSAFERFAYPGLPDILKQPAGENRPKNFTLPSETEQLLEDVKRKSGYDNNPDAIRASLASVYELLAVRGLGGRVFVKSPDGSTIRRYKPLAPFDAQLSSPVAMTSVANGETPDDGPAGLDHPNNNSTAADARSLEPAFT